MESLRLLGKLLAVSIRGQMQYRVSFALSVAGQFAITAIEFLGVWALFARFGNLRDWTLAEVALFYGVVNVAFAGADSLATGFDRMGVKVKSGEFDRVLVRPRSTLLQLAGEELALRRIGRLAQGLLILGWAAVELGVDWGAAETSLLLFALAGGACLFFGLFVVQATICFWTVETMELMNTMTYGGVESAQYPLVIYGKWFRRFFTFVVPLAAVCYFPVVGILGRPDPLGSPLWFQYAAPTAGFAFLAATLGIWRLGVRRYTSTGS